jgi:hypothetical protein
MDGATFASIIGWGLPLVILIDASLFIVALLVKRGRT